MSWTRVFAVSVLCSSILTSGLLFGQSSGPSPVSVNPSSGSGNSQIFSFQFQDSNGYADIRTIDALISTRLNWSGACGIYYDAQTNQLLLSNDAGTGWSGPVTLGQNGTVLNSECTVDASRSSVNGSGLTLTINLALSFPIDETGSKNIWGAAQNQTANSGWMMLGTWMVTESQSVPNSVMPHSGSGSSSVFSFQYYDFDAYSDIASTETMINLTLSWTAGCGTYYDPHSNELLLANDTYTGWFGPVKLGSVGTVENSQCTIDAQSSSVAGSGNYLTVNLAVKFKAAFAGAKTIWAAAQKSGSNSGWDPLGIWTVTNSSLDAVSVTPSSGNGTSQIFTFQYADTAGVADITSTDTSMNSILSWSGGCGTYYNLQSNQLLLANDAGNGWVGPIALGATGMVQNSQCAIDASHSSVSKSGNTLTIGLSINFQPSVSGTLNIWGAVQNQTGANSGWSILGSWTP